MNTLSLNKVIDWKSNWNPSDLSLEQIVGINNFQHPWFLEKGLERSRAVGLITRTQGTGFLIGNNLIMTNWHILRNSTWAKDNYILFDYEQNEDRIPIEPNKVALDPDLFFYSNEQLDFTVVGVQGSPGEIRGKIDIQSPGFVSEDSRVNIIQHPGGEFKKIAIRDNGIKYFDETILQYWTDTEHGSSGSPLFDDKWNIIGLHYRNDNAPSPSGKVYFNEGHQISAILEALKNNNPEFISML